MKAKAPTAAAIDKAVEAMIEKLAQVSYLFEPLLERQGSMAITLKSLSGRVDALGDLVDRVCERVSQLNQQAGGSSPADTEQLEAMSKRVDSFGMALERALEPPMPAAEVGGGRPAQAGGEQGQYPQGAQAKQLTPRQQAQQTISGQKGA